MTEEERLKFQVGRTRGTPSCITLEIHPEGCYDIMLVTLSNEQARQLARDLAAQVYGPAKKRLIVFTSGRKCAAAPA